MLNLLLVQKAFWMNRHLMTINDMKQIRYVREWNDGNSDNGHLAHWIELEVFSNGMNVALNKPVSTNFYPNLDVSGQSLPKIIVDNNISLESYVSISLDLQRHRPAMVVIDLRDIYECEAIQIWHGWWNPKRWYKTVLEISTDGGNWEKIYDWESDQPIYETQYGHLYEL